MRDQYDPPHPRQLPARSPDPITQPAKGRVCRVDLEAKIDVVAVDRMQPPHEDPGFLTRRDVLGMQHAGGAYAPKISPDVLVAELRRLFSLGVDDGDGEQAAFDRDSHDGWVGRKVDPSSALLIVPDEQRRLGDDPRTGQAP